MVFAPYLSTISLEGLDKTELASLEKRLASELELSKLKAADVERALEKVRNAIGQAS